MTDRPLTPADPADVAEAVHYAMRFGLDGKPLGKKIREDADWMARHVVQHLARANFKVMQGPPLQPHSTGRLMGETNHTGDGTPATIKPLSKGPC
jgi:hypothetical protein